MGLAFVERLQQGILDYAQEQGGWSFTRIPELLSPSIRWLRHWPGDGAFVLITTGADAKIARRLAIPVVNLAGHLEGTEVPSVTVDHRATGRLAAEHLLARRFQRFGFYGTQGQLYSQQRRAGFCEAVERAGGSRTVLEVHELAGERTEWTDQQEELEAWLRSLVPPAGVMASTDLRACMVLDACGRLGLRVPEDIAVIGVDNDPVACEFRHPTLTSVSRNDREVGYRAAELLDRLMRGAAVGKKVLLIPPDGVVQRGSTEVLALEDPELAGVVGWIQGHLPEPFGVAELMRHVAISRRRLEQRFRECLGRSPHRFISEQRVERARKLLAAPGKRSLTDIAAACGFTEPRRFRLVFQRVTGQTPAAFRQGLAGR
jgi:LacI family transcriptional regulator